MHKVNRIAVAKTDKLNQQKISILVRRFHISMDDARDLQQGYVVEVATAIAYLLLAADLVQRVDKDTQTTDIALPGITLDNKPRRSKYADV